MKQELEQELEKLYRNNFFHVIAFKITQDKETASDLVQDTIIRLYDVAHLYTECDKLQQFIKTVMSRVYLNTLRQNRYKLKYDQFVKDVNAVQHQNINNENQADYCYLMQLIDRVSYSDRHYLKYMLCEYRGTEIAQEINKNDNTVRMHLKRIRQEISR